MAAGQYQPLSVDEDDKYDSDGTPEETHELIPLSETDHQFSRSIVSEKDFNLSRFLLQRPRFSRCCIAISVPILAILVALFSGGGFLWYSAVINDGQSPPWYPTPQGGTLSSWQNSYEKARTMVERMTLPEKINITTGTGWAMDLCVGNTGSAVSAGFPSLCLQDGPLGLRFADNSTSFPAGVTAGSTWNRDLLRRRGAAHGREAKAKGINMLLGPCMGALGRNPAGGRVWEGFGSDPVLQAIASYETIVGIQSQGVMATAKHFIGNEQEHFRKPFEWGLPEALSSNIDDRTLHEVYGWPFAESVRAGVASVMCSYQMINNSYGCQNSKLLNGILKDEMGFQGFVVTDWLAQRSGVASALAGLDMSMPGDGLYWLDGKALFGSQLTLAVLNGSVPIQRVDDMAIRIVAAWYQLGQDKWEDQGPNFSSWTHDEMGKWHERADNSKDKGIVNHFVHASTQESRQVARDVATEGTVLLKNDGILPLDPDLSSLATLATGKARVMIVGEDAGPGDGPNVCEDRACNQGTLAVGWGSGATEFTYLIDPFSALNATFTSSVHVTASLKNSMDTDTARQLTEQDLCLVFASADSGEGYLSWNGIRADRPDLKLQKDGSLLVKDVAEHCGGPTIAVIHAVGPVILEDFADLPNVKAIVFANLPGQESGNALSDVLFGKADASGRLVFTIGKSLDDYGEGAKVLYYPNHIVPQINFDEGLYIDYRHFDKFEIEPRYPFGYGLSYTTFEISNLTILPLKPKSPEPDPRPRSLTPPTFNSTIPDARSALFPEGFFKLKKYIYPYIASTRDVKFGSYPYPDGYDVARPQSSAGGGEGGNPSLYEIHLQVRVHVKNTGSRAGKEVIQLYLSFPADIHEGGSLIDTPVRVLRNFHKLELQPGSSEEVVLNLTRKDLSYWSVLRQNWIMPVDGKFIISIGKSSRDIVLTGEY